MKKILFLLLLIFLLTSCYEFAKEQEATKIMYEGKIPFTEAIHFEYQKHEYIKFYQANGSATNSGVVHNANCKYCKDK